MKEIFHLAKMWAVSMKKDEINFEEKFEWMYLSLGMLAKQNTAYIFMMLFFCSLLLFCWNSLFLLVNPSDSYFCSFHSYLSSIYTCLLIYRQTDSFHMYIEDVASNLFSWVVLNATIPPLLGFTSWSTNVPF